MPRKNETPYCSGPCKGGLLQGIKCCECEERAKFAAIIRKEYPENYRRLWANYRRFQLRKAIALAKNKYDLQEHDQITQFSHFSIALEDGETLSKFKGHGPSNADTCKAWNSEQQSQIAVGKKHSLPPRSGMRADAARTAAAAQAAAVVQAAGAVQASH